MLILTRRNGETLNIGDQVSVTVLGIKGNQVRLGVQAPKNIVVDREEISERKRREGDQPRASSSMRNCSHGSPSSKDCRECKAEGLS
jgi:carbon storage regulator